MNAIFRGCGKLVQANRRWLALPLTLLVFVFSGCHDMDSNKETLRKNDLSEPARQVRAKESIDKGIDKARESKGTDDFLMSSEAKNIYHNMD